MNLESLRSVQADERGTTDLQPLPDSFYRDVATYLEELREQRDRAASAAEDPFGSDEVRRLTDEIETAEEVIEAIYERRMGKVVNRASLAAAGMGADEEGLTTEEAELFTELVAVIEDHRAEVLDVLHRQGPLTGTDDEAAAPPDAPSGEPQSPGMDTDTAKDQGGTSGRESDTGTGPASDTHGPSGDPDSPETPGSGSPSTAPDDEPRVTVRITQDVGEIFGVDERTYHLSTEDVVTLPKANADPLLERDAAERID